MTKLAIFRKNPNMCEAKLKSVLPGRQTERSGETGFSLIEVMVAMVVFLIAMLGIFVAFTFAVSYNAGNKSRAQALAILQQRVEQMRSARFVPDGTDPRLAGGTRTPEIYVNPADGHSFRIDLTVDDDPLTSGIQVDDDRSLKEVTVTVSLEKPTPGWQTSVPAVVVLRRVRGN